MKPTRSAVSVALAALFAHACAVPSDPRAPSAEGTFELDFALSARDARGRAAPLEGIARRPEFVLSSARPLLPVELVLFAGEPDADLLDDLAALPLRAASERRLVPSRTVQAGSELRLAARITLAKEAAYTLALPGTARAAGGAALGGGGPAFIAQLRTAGDASAGAAWVRSLPAPGQRGVPVNLDSVYLALDGALEAGSSLEEAAWLEAPDGSAFPAEVERVECEGLETSAGAITCAQLVLNGELAPAARYVVRSGRGLRDARGAPVEPLTAAFETASEPDRRPPEFDPVGCLSDEHEAAFGCLAAGDTWVELTLRSDESVHVAARPTDPSAQSTHQPPRDTGLAQRITAQLAPAGDASLRLLGLEPDSPFSLTLTATDLAGNFTEVRVTGATVARLATLSITEVLADPEGTDASQEYVEIWNFGRDPVVLRGILIADASAKPSVVASDVELAADARALLVSDSFEAFLQPSAAGDLPSAGANARPDGPRPAGGSGLESRGFVPAGVRVIRVGSALTKGGIANAGEALYLRDAAGHRLSAAPARATTAGRCLQRTGSDPRAGALEDFVEARCSPGDNLPQLATAAAPEAR